MKRFFRGLIYFGRSTSRIAVAVEQQNLLLSQILDLYKLQLDLQGIRTIDPSIPDEVEVQYGAKTPKYQDPFGFEE